MPVVGTAGHVDHGKSTLIQRITGRNPDRWTEEQERGLTIDLGFAWAILPDGSEVSFVDVPGHERFLKNMLAGIEAIDVALFVVAADEGWMPQSEEHLAVLDLLDVSRGVVAVTKADAVDADLLDLAMAEVGERLEGTSLSSAPIVPVSGRTGDGVARLLGELAAQLPTEAFDGARPRLWVDRSFAVPGAGTIVTGTLLDGWLSVDETVTIAPAGNNSRIRGIQSHEAAHGSVGPGRRVALNLGGIDHHDIGRGDMLGLPGQWVASDRFAVSLRLARFIGDIDRRGAFQLHIGSASRRVEISGLDGDVAVFQTRTGLPLTIGDRFILRDTGRQTVVAGGRVLDPAPGRTARALQSARSVDPAATPDEIADSVLSLRGADELSRIAAHSRGGRPTHAVIIGERAMTPARLDELTRRASSMVAAEHERHPLRPGMPMATLAERLSTGSAIVEWLVVESNDLERIGPDVAVAGRSHGLTDIQRTAWEAAQDRLATSLAVPGEAELGLDRDVVAHLLRTGELVRVSDDLVYLPSQIEEIKTRMAEMEKDFTVAEFRDRAGLSRKYAVPILEWSDKEGLTVRRGDLRHFR